MAAFSVRHPPPPHPPGSFLVSPDFHLAWASSRSLLGRSALLLHARPQLPLTHPPLEPRNPQRLAGLSDCEERRRTSLKCPCSIYLRRSLRSLLSDPSLPLRSVREGFISTGPTGKVDQVRGKQDTVLTCSRTSWGLASVLCGKCSLFLIALFSALLRHN